MEMSLTEYEQSVLIALSELVEESEGQVTPKILHRRVAEKHQEEKYDNAIAYSATAFIELRNRKFVTNPTQDTVDLTPQGKQVADGLRGKSGGG